MTNNEQDWGMYYVHTIERPQPQPNLASQFVEGWEVALGLHMLEGVN